jgi:hypothetical protein
VEDQKRVRFLSSSIICQFLFADFFFRLVTWLGPNDAPTNPPPLPPPNTSMQIYSPLLASFGVGVGVEVVSWERDRPSGGPGPGRL